MKLEIYYNYGRTKIAGICFILLGILFFVALFMYPENYIPCIAFGVLFLIGGVLIYKQNNRGYSEIINCEKFEVLKEKKNVT